MKKSLLPLLALVISAAGSAFAAPVVPTYTTFGNLAGATFGGSGIPTNPTAITTIVDGNNTIKLGLTAFGRYSNPAIANDGAGVFTAGVGINDGLGTPPQLLGTTWGFGYYIDITGGGKFGNYSIDLLYDLDAGAGTNESALGQIHFSMGLPAFSHFEDSQNLYFGFLASNANLPVIVPPAFTAFDGNAAGEYSFALVVKNSSGAELGRSAILVNTVPDAASTATLLLAGFAGLVALRRRR